MSKSVYKFKPGSPWKIGITESWLNSMAKRGLFIEKMGKYFGKFNKDEPRDMYYRIEMSEEKDELSEEQIRMYKARGWGYVTNYNNFHIFSSPYEFNTTEVHIIPEEYAQLLKPFYKKALTQLLISFAILFAFYAVIPMFIAKRYVSVLVNMSYLELFSPLIIISTFINGLFEIIYIGKLRKCLLQGTSVDHNAPWKFNYIVSIFISSCLILLSTTLVTLTFTSLFTGYDDEKTIPDDTTSMAIIRLKEIENSETLEETPISTSEEVNYERRYNLKKTFFAPLKYTSFELGSIMTNPTTTYLKSHDAILNNEVYQVRFKSMSQKLLLELWKDGEDSKADDTTPPILHDDELDLLIVQETSDGYEIYACKGKGVMRVIYTGEEDVNKIIPLIKQKISLISK